MSTLPVNYKGPEKQSFLQFKLNKEIAWRVWERYAFGHNCDENEQRGEYVRRRRLWYREQH